MGIKGLLQFLKEQQKIDNLKSYRGCTAAVDVYCWLHRAVYGCVEQIAIAGNDQGQYIKYCEKYWNTLKSFGIKPILVFDGQNLPAKAHTEKERQDRRKANRDKANALLAEGKKSEARQYFERCIDITPHMAHKVIVAAVSQGIDCIVAPYEADAQLAYLSITGIAQLIISEDSDLLCFGCERVMFKLDLNGNGIVQERSRVLEHKLFRKRFTFEHFVQMCILSGCDYIPSLPGIGLAKARKYISQNQFTSDMTGMLRRLPLSIKLPSDSVTDEYIEQFKNAVMTFKHQVIYDPVSRTRKPMTPFTDTCCGLSEHPENMAFAGRYFPAQQATQMALGNINLHTMETLLPEIDPDLLLSRENGRLSVWHPEYKPKGQWSKDDPMAIDRGNNSTKDKSILIPTERVVRKRRLSQSEAQGILDGLTNENASITGLTNENASITESAEPSSEQNEEFDSISTVTVTPKPSKSSRKESSPSPDEEMLEDTEEDWLKGPGSPPKLTAKEKNNMVMKDKLRGIYHRDREESTAVTVTSRYFGSTQDEVPDSSETTELDQVRSSPQHSSQSEAIISQFNPSQISTQYDNSSPTKYKAKFLGALDQLDTNPSSQAKAFRWSKSSIHEQTANSDLLPAVNQQFKSPLLKSRLVQITAGTLSTDKNSAEGTVEEASPKPKINPFKQRSKVSRTIRTAVTANPFKTSSSPTKKERAIFGRAVEDKQLADTKDPFSAKQLTRIGSKSDKDPISQKLSAFKLIKQYSPVKGGKSNIKPTLHISRVDQSVVDSPSLKKEKENLIDCVPKPKFPSCSSSASRVLASVVPKCENVMDSGYVDAADIGNDYNDSTATPLKVVAGDNPEELSLRGGGTPTLSNSSNRENTSTDNGRQQTPISAFLSKFTRTRTEKMKSNRSSSSSLNSSIGNKELVVDLT